MSLPHVRIDNKGAAVRVLAVTLVALAWLLVVGGQATAWAVPDTRFATATPPTPNNPPPAPAETENSTPSFTFAYTNAPNGATFECELDGAGFTPCTSPHTISPALTEGTHTFSVRAVDATGADQEPSIRTFIYKNRPFTSIPSSNVNTPPAKTAIITPEFTFTSDEALGFFECRVDAAPFAQCLSPYTTAPLATGPHSFEVRAVDTDGNADLTPARRDFIIDDGPPQTFITGEVPPGGTTTDSTPTFTFISDELDVPKFECRVDAEPYATCTTPHTIATPLANGEHTFNVRATDVDGNVDPFPGNRVFFVNAPITDTTPPVVTVTSPAANATYVIGQPVNAAYSCTDSGGSGDPSCVGTVAVGAAIDTATPGAKTFTVTSTDTAGNTQTTDVQYTVSKAATTTTVGSSVNPSVSGQTVTYTATVAITAPGSGTLSGTVAFTDGASTIAGCGTVALVGSQAKCTVTYPTPGSKAIKATYGGTSLLMGSSSTTLTQTVAKAATTLVAAKAGRGLLSITFSATLRRNHDSALLQGKTVAFKIGGSTMCSATTNSAGKATCSVGGLILGGGTYTATYAGDGTYLASSGTAQY